jgi:hypothetical protein
VLHERTFLERSIDDHLGGDRLASSFSFVRCKYYATFTVLNAISERFRGESSKHDTVHGSDTRASEECGNGLPCHGEIYGDCVPFFDAETFEDVGYAANFTKKFGVTDVSALAWLICLVDNGSLVRVLESPAIYTVVRCIESTFREPSDISCLKAAGSDGVERSIPIKRFFCDLGPPGIRSRSYSFSVCYVVSISMRSDMGLRMMLKHSRSYGMGWNVDWLE